MKEERFYMVYGFDQGRPTIRHDSYEIAKAEALRLSRVIPGVKFFVMETVAVAEKIDVQFTDFRKRSDALEVPF